MVNKTIEASIAELQGSIERLTATVDGLNARLTERLETLEPCRIEQPNAREEPRDRPGVIPFRDRVLVGIDEIADHCGVCAKTIRNQSKAGNFPKPNRHVGRRVLWEPSTIEAWLTGKPGQFTKKRKG